TEFYAVPAFEVRADLLDRGVAKDQLPRGPRKIFSRRGAAFHGEASTLKQPHVSTRQQHGIPDIAQLHGTLTDDDAHVTVPVIMNREYGADVTNYRLARMDRERSGAVVNDAKERFARQHDVAAARRDAGRRT